MKVNKMIGKAMAASIAATVMLGGVTVMADSRGPIRPEDLDQLRLPYYEAIRHMEDDKESDVVLPETELPSGDQNLPDFAYGIVVVPEEPGVDETREGLPYYTGDIIRIGREPVTLPTGSYRLMICHDSYLTFRNPVFSLRGNSLFVNDHGLGIKIGSGYVALRVVVDINNAMELHPLTQDQLDFYEPGVQPDVEIDETVIPEIPEIPETSEAIASPEVPEMPVTPEASVVPTTADSAPAAPTAEPAVATSTPSAVHASTASAPATLVAGASRSGVEDFVNRLYTVALGRDADPTGFAYWVDMLNSNQMTATEVANGFLSSPEFTARDLNNVEYLTVLYKTFFDREPDHNGLNHWVSSIQNSLLTREQVIEGFTNSTEWANTCNTFGIEA